jgi:hypothetical protein
VGGGGAGAAWPRRAAPSPAGSGAGSPRSASHARIIAVSSRCDTSMRSATSRTAALPARAGTSAVIASACAWWPSMPRMNAASAGV